ncbi:hypothetical protein AAFP35_02215 [Gordonia sp. CPCC 206044]|uniref:hypothetical protein n=1 Tax=Gordonia sp. CPCC 206044 TaxID=3140793 RepID=UPI003AF38836
MSAPTVRRLFGTAPVFLVVVTVGLIAGSATFLLAPTSRAAAPADPSPQRVDSARESVDSAKMMFTLMSSALNSATGSIKSVSGSATEVFDAVDTARSASTQIVDGLRSAPSTSSAVAEVERLTSSVSSGIDDVQTLSRTAGQMDELVTPLITFVQTNKVPGSDDLLNRLESLRSASRDVQKQTAALGSLRHELDTITSSLGTAGAHVDEGISQARTAARQLDSGLSTLASARADTVAAAKKVSDGVGQLIGVLSSITNNLNSASTNLTPQTDTPVASTVDNSDRTALALLVGALSALAALSMIVFMTKRPRPRITMFGRGGDTRHQAEATPA